MRIQVQQIVRLVLTMAMVVAASAATVQLAHRDWAQVSDSPGDDARLLDPSQSRELLRDLPLAGAPFRALGDRAASAGDASMSARYYLTAARREPRDAQARLKLVDLYLAAGDEAAAIHHLDVLLRIAPEAGDPLLRRILGLTGRATVRDALARHLSFDPPWRQSLPGALATTPDPADAERLLSLLAMRSPLRPDELALRVSLLERLQRPLDARRVWGESLPAELRALDGLVFDGGFDHGEGPEPYGWRLESPVGAAVGVERSGAPEGGSLALLFEGRAVEFAGVSQDIVLWPGRFRLALMARTDVDGSVRPFAWTITCRGTDLPVARLEVPGLSHGWKKFETEFEVPPSCPIQRLALMHGGRSLSERRLAGRMQFDAIEIDEAGR